MSNYLKNVYMFFRGIPWLWTRDLDRLAPAEAAALNGQTISYKPNWTPEIFLLLYLIDYGFNCLVLANQIVSVSAYCFIRRKSQPWKSLGAALDWIQARHIEDAVSPLWGSKENSGRVRVLIPILWLSGGIAFWLWHRHGSPGPRP